jgi:hypothetical protein
MKKPNVAPLKMIRLKCLECSGNQFKEVRFCVITDCPLWFFRFGSRQQTIIKREGPGAKELFDPENFTEGEKFDPEREVPTEESPRMPPLSQKVLLPEASYSKIGIDQGKPMGKRPRRTKRTKHSPSNNGHSLMEGR